MFVLTAKVSKTKLAAIVVLLIAIVVGIVMLSVGSVGGGAGQTPEGIPGDSEDARLSFLAQHGWNVNATPIKTQQVVIPEDPEDEIFRRYNALQTAQGFDLSALSGQTVMRYVYEILNYPDATEPVYATVFVKDGVIVGGDVTNTAPDGKMHGFDLP